MLFKMAKFLKRDMIGFVKFMRKLKIKKNIDGKKIKV